MDEPGTDHPSPPRRRNRRPRLDAAVYGFSGYAVHVVADTKGQAPLFEDPQLAREVLRLLHELAAHYGIRLHCVCLMPQHVHMVISVEQDGKPVPQFVKLFKSRIAWHLRGRLPQGPWQRSFYDRVVRRTEDLRSVCLYVLQNPQAAGLVDDWRNYEFSWLAPELGSKA
jgi:REP element-mobilizing transposase RayT